MKPSEILAKVPVNKFIGNAYYNPITDEACPITHIAIGYGWKPNLNSPAFGESVEAVLRDKKIPSGVLNEIVGATDTRLRTRLGIKRVALKILRQNGL